MTKLEQENCSHDLKYRTFALVGGRSYTNCTKCDKSWETTNTKSARNIIKYAKVDGCPAKTGVKNGLMVFYHNIIFSSIVVETETDQILFVGDTINTDDGELKVRERIYYPEDNHFDFLCDSVYTGRRE